MDLDLRGKTAIVTGSAAAPDGRAGAGRSIALLLGAAGANVVAVWAQHDGSTCIY